MPDADTTLACGENCAHGTVLFSNVSMSACVFSMGARI